MLYVCFGRVARTGSPSAPRFSKSECKMPKVQKVSISAAKTEQLADKRLRAEGAYLRAIGSKEPRGIVSFAGSAMHIGSTILSPDIM